MATNVSRGGSRRRRLPPFFQVVKRRTECLFYVFFGAYALLACRLGYIQVAQHQWYAKTAAKWHSRDATLLARRGAIFTRDGHQLAVTIQCASVFVHPHQVEASDRGKAIQLLSRILGLSPNEVRQKVESDKKFVYIARHVPMSTVDQLKARLKGTELTEAIGMEEDKTKRVYPSGSLASTILGFTNTDGRGLEGIEKVFDRTLGGVNGAATVLVDARQKAIADTQIVERAARDGKPITLSIDYGLQRAAEKELDKTAQMYHPAGATCTVMDVHTGEILAMATYPRFDPNKPTATDPNNLRNRAITDAYEPGSTLKTITMASALDSGAITLHSSFWCGGREKIGKRTIRCVIHHPFKGKHGAVRAQEIIEHSCNIGAAKVGLKMGQDTLKTYLHRLGLDQKTGIELIGEVARPLYQKDHWADIRTANVAFGQGIAVTPLQLLTAYAAVANGGKLIQPTILRRTGPAPGKQILKPGTAKKTLALLKDCVDFGTGKPAKIRGYEVGGKTGSAQKADGIHGYRNRKFIASFASVLPVDDPRIAILVTVDEPHGTHWGAVAAAPAVREVARQAVLELGIPPNNPADVVDGADRKTWRKGKTT
jgi:cell division protein FtsI/penicillin-binding protein 2